MGPRPRGRGIVGEGVKPHLKTVELQWDRARAGAEFQCDLCGDYHLTHASMGPRPRGRGIEGAALRTSNAHAASMGPRPRGRGIAANKTTSERWKIPLQWGRARAGAEL